MNKALLFIFITVLLDVIGLGIIIPIAPELIMEITGKSLSDSSVISGWLMTSYSLMLFFCAPIIGGLSDRYGRRPILLITLLIFGLDYLLQALAPNIHWLYAGRIIAGITGASFTVATSFIADVSEPDKKAQNFGLIGAAFGLGFIIGPLLGAVLGNYGVRVPFYASATLALLNCIFGYFVLPESLLKKNRRKFDGSRSNPFGTLRVLIKYDALKSFIPILLLVYTAHYSLQSTWNYYTMFKFKWSHQLVGYSLAFVGVLMAIVQGVLTRIIIPQIGPYKSIIIGFVAAILGYLGFSLAKEGWWMYVFMIPFSLSGLAGPSIQSLISNKVPPNSQGELQGGITSLMSFAAIIGPVIMTTVFHFFSDSSRTYFFPGASFFLSFLFLVLSLLLAIRPIRKLASAN
ncbi:MAG: TCR/Tet family MFS transporter [Saprospiraceae bacterium]|nr:TCR/Tet family MFS transporter [Saprospiraceae bacterium]